MILRIGLLVIVLCIWLSTPAPIAWAHPEIIRTEPAAGAQLTTAPSRVRVVFNEALEPALSRMDLYDSQRVQIAGGGGVVPDTPTTLELTLSPLDAGVYTVIWQTVGSDGHRIGGNFAFTIERSAGVSPSVVPSLSSILPQGSTTALPLLTPTAVPALEPSSLLPPPGPPLVLVALLRALMLVGAISFLGGWFWYSHIFVPAIAAAQEGTEDVVSRWRWLMMGSLAVLLLTTPLFLMVHTWSVAGSVDGMNLATVLRETRLGHLLGARMLLTLALIACIVSVQQSEDTRSWLGAGALLLGGALLLTFSLGGHAAAVPSPIAVVADWLHLTATALWIGSLGAFVIVVPRVLRSRDTIQCARLLATIITAFSTLALGCIVVLTLSGTYTALLHLNSLSDLWTSGYGRALLVKLVLFSMVLLLGAYHLLLVRPRFVAWANQRLESLLAQRWQRWFPWTLRSEVVLGLLILFAVGFLTSLAPASGDAQEATATIPTAPSSQAAREVIQGEPTSLTQPTLQPQPTAVPPVPFVTTRLISDVQVSLDIAPARLGYNHAQVTITDSAGAPIVAQLVRVQLDMPVMDMGSQTLELPSGGNGPYVTDDLFISMIGEWRITVIVRRADADDVETTFTVPIGDAPGAPVITNPAPGQQQINGVTIALDTAAQSALYAGQSFRITLTDEQGNPIGDADVYVDLEMRNERMGTNRPVANHIGNGVYEATGVYTMAGLWEVDVVVIREGIERRATFTTQVIQ